MPLLSRFEDRTFDYLTAVLVSRFDVFVGARTRVSDDTRRGVVKLAVVIAAKSRSHRASKGSLLNNTGPCVGSRPQMLHLKRLNHVELHCTDARLFWEQLSHLVEGHDFLILRKVLALCLLLLNDVLFLLVRAGSNFRDACPDALVVDGAFEPSIGRAEKLVLCFFKVLPESRWDGVSTGTWSRLALLSKPHELLLCVP